MANTQDPAPAGSEQKRDPYAALRIRKFRFYSIAWFVALLGTRIQSVAIGWEMYERTGEALSLGLVGLAQALPTMLLALPAGYLADRYNRPKLVMISLLAMTATSLGLAGLSYTQGSASWMYVLLFLDAAVVMLGRPARVALVPQLVPTRIFSNAVTWNTSMMQVASVAGPAVGGLLLVVNVPLAYVVAAASSLLFAISLWFLRLPSGDKEMSGASITSVLAGMKFVWNTHIVLVAITLDLFAVLLGGAVYLLPIYAKDILGVGAQGFGILRAAPAVGAFCMAILLTHLPPIRHAGRILLACVAGFGVATIIFGLSQTFWVSFLMLFLTGAFDNVSMIVRHTLQQLMTPDRMRGRVSAVTSIFVGASNELGGLESGLVAHWFGPVISVVSGGIGTLIVVGVTTIASPALRNFGALDEAKPEESAIASGNEVASGVAPLGVEGAAGGSPD